MVPKCALGKFLLAATFLDINFVKIVHKRGGALCSDLLYRVCIKSMEQYFFSYSLLGDASRYKKILKNYWEHYSLGEKNYILKKHFFVTRFEIES